MCCNCRSFLAGSTCLLDADLSTFHQSPFLTAHHAFLGTLKACALPATSAEPHQPLPCQALATSQASFLMTPSHAPLAMCGSRPLTLSRPATTWAIFQWQPAMTVCPPQSPAVSFCLRQQYKLICLSQMIPPCSGFSQYPFCSGPPQVFSCSQQCQPAHRFRHGAFLHCQSAPCLLNKVPHQSLLIVMSHQDMLILRQSAQALSSQRLSQLQGSARMCTVLFQSLWMAL